MWLLAIFLAVYIYRLTESENKRKAAIYPWIGFGFIVLVAFIVSRIAPNMASEMGTMAGLIAPISGTLACFTVPKKKPVA